MNVNELKSKNLKINKNVVERIVRKEDTDEEMEEVEEIDITPTLESIMQTL